MIVCVCVCLCVCVSVVIYTMWKLTQSGEVRIPRLRTISGDWHQIALRNLGILRLSSAVVDLDYYTEMADHYSSSSE